MAKANSNSAQKTPMVREKEVFRFEGMVNVDGTDVRCYVKAAVNYERLTHKVTPVITYSHGWVDNADVRDLFRELTTGAVSECVRRLEVYRGEMGIGAQGDLFENAAQGEAVTG